MTTITSMLNSATANINMGPGSSFSMNKSTGNVVSNAVTINSQAGVMTTPSLNFGPGAYNITLTNSEIANFTATSSANGYGYIAIQLMGGTNTTEMYILADITSSTTALIQINNVTNATNMNGTVIIGFALM